MSIDPKNKGLYFVISISLGMPCNLSYGRSWGVFIGMIFSFDFMYKRIDVKGMPVRNCLIHGLIGAVHPLQKYVHVRSDTSLSQL